MKKDYETLCFVVLFTSEQRSDVRCDTRSMLLQEQFQLRDYFF